MLDLLLSVSTSPGSSPGLSDGSRHLDEVPSVMRASGKEESPCSSVSLPVPDSENEKETETEKDGVPKVLDFSELLAKCCQRESDGEELAEATMCGVPMCAETSGCDDPVLPIESVRTIPAGTGASDSVAESARKDLDTEGADGGEHSGKKGTSLFPPQKIETVEERLSASTEKTTDTLASPEKSDGISLSERAVESPETDGTHSSQAAESAAGARSEPSGVRDGGQMDMDIPLIRQTEIPSSRMDAPPESDELGQESRSAPPDFLVHSVLSDVRSSETGLHQGGGEMLELMPDAVRVSTELPDEGVAADNTLAAEKAVNDSSSAASKVDVAWAIKDGMEAEQGRDSARSRLATPVNASVDPSLLDMIPSGGGRASAENGGAWSSTASVAAPERPPSSMTSDELLRNLDRLVVQAARADDNLVRIELEPAALGRVVLQCRETSDGLSVEIIVRDEAVRSLLSAQESTLRGQMESRGLALDEFSVTSRDQERADSRREAKERASRQESGTARGVGDESDLDGERMGPAWMAQGTRNYWVA